MNSKYREEYMESLTNNAKEIISKTEKTDQDKIQLLIYKKELARYEKVPLLKTILNGTSQVISFLNKFNDKGV